MINKLLKEFERKHCRCIDAYKDRDLHDPQCQVHDLIPEFANELARQSKAYGGCTKCYGKGYSTEAVGNTVASADFNGDKEVVLEKARVVLNYCKCDRGKQLDKLIKIELARQRRKLK